MQPEISAAMPQAQLIGKGRLNVFGFKVYDARLWAAPDFRSRGDTGYATQPLALELHYLRDFKALDIAERSIKEMRRSASIPDAQEAKWLLELQRVVPDVKKGDRILGIHKPGTGANFWVNGKHVGDIQDAEFARLFFGIWLSPKTSEPQIRTLLLGGNPG
ncbi:MAG: chalcone isomerase family protein [Polaromonas sp.]|nr:chalcone isomerase family protein [Polaromonas sp.]